MMLTRSIHTYLSRITTRNTKLNLLFLVSFTTLLSSGVTHGEELKYVRIDGQAQALILVRRSAIQYGIDDSKSGNIHYKASLKDFPESKGSIAYIDNQWQGMLLHQGQLLDIRDVADSPEQLGQSSRALTADVEMGQCGVRSFSPIVPSSGLQTITAASLLSKATRIDYEQFCQSEVEDVCLVAELNVIFDSQFEDAFGSSYRSQAVDILNRVNDIYRDNFGIQFKAINVGFGDGDEVTTSNNISDVLQDLTDKRLAGELSSFDTNPDSLLHLVSGRDYGNSSDGAIGLAWISGYGNNYPDDVTPILCSDYAIGTTQVYGTSNPSRVLLTSIIMAHELGHNFGFDHDGESGSYAESCLGNFIMSASISPNLDTFSSCSQEALPPNINGLNPIEQCFDYPVAASIQANGSDITLDNLQPFIQQYQVIDDNLANQSLSLMVTGTLSNTDAQFNNVTLGGNSCNLSSNNRSYSCAIIAPRSSSLLDLGINPGNEDMLLEQTVTLTGASNIHELSDENNSSTQTIRFRGSNIPPGALSATTEAYSASLAWTDRSDNETSFRIEARADGTTWEIIEDTIAADTQQFLVDGLDELTQYEFRVVATFPDNSSSASNVVTVNTLNGPNDAVIAVVSGGGSGGGGGGGSLGWLGLMVLLSGLLIRNRNL